MGVNDKLVEFSKFMTVKDMPNDELKWIAEDLGVKTAVQLICHFSGIQMYIPKETKTELMRAYVRRSYNGHNAKSLAVSLGVAERTIYSWLKEKNKIDSLNVVQTTLFDG